MMDIRKKQRLDHWLGAAMLVILRLPVIILGNFLERDHNPSARGAILVIKMLGGGSLVIAYPALLGIRRRYPDRLLVLLTTPNLKQFGESLNIFDEIICVRDAGMFSLVSSAAAAWLRCFRRFDTVIDFEVYSKLTTVFSVLTAARNRIGFYLENTYWRKRIHSHLLFFNRFSGSYYFYDAIGRLLDAQIPARTECEERFREGMVTATKAKGKRRISVGHACSDFGTERMLTPGQWAQVIARQNAREEELTFLGGKADRDAAEKIIVFLRKRFPGISFANLSGSLSLKESVSYIDSSDEFWGIDSALLHYARLLGKKTVSFWGPTDPQTRLRNEPGLFSNVHYKKVPCSPCIHVAEMPPCRGRNMCIESLFDETGPRSAIGDVRV